MRTHSRFREFYLPFDRYPLSTPWLTCHVRVHIRLQNHLKANQSVSLMHSGAKPIYSTACAAPTFKSSMKLPRQPSRRAERRQSRPLLRRQTPTRNSFDSFRHHILRSSMSPTRAKCGSRLMLRFGSAAAPDTLPLISARATVFKLKPSLAAATIAGSSVNGKEIELRVA